MTTIQKSARQLSQRAPAVRPRILLTEQAAAQMGILLAAASEPGLRLRMFAKATGCSSLEYGFTYAEHEGANDLTLDQHGVSVLIDALSYQRMMGARIDCQEAPGGMQFVIDNPNVNPDGACGCGGACGMDA